MAKPEVLNLESTFLRLRNDATVEPLSVDDTFWERLMGGKLGDFHHEYLVITTSFDADWLSSGSCRKAAAGRIIPICEGLV